MAENNPDLQCVIDTREKLESGSSPVNTAAMPGRTGSLGGGGGMGWGGGGWGGWVAGINKRVIDTAVTVVPGTVGTVIEIHRLQRRPITLYVD